MNISDYFKKSSDTILKIKDESVKVQNMANVIFNSQKKGGKLLIVGNGGSCADAEHFAGELTCTYNNPKRAPFNAISLSNNASAITAWSNDFNFRTFYERQVLAMGKADDVIFFLTTSGGDREKEISMNLVQSADIAKKLGLKVLSLVGKTGGELEKISDICIKIPSFTTSHIQECHIAIIHCICELIDHHEKY
jgi:D-sedoheptulose 7-phosphate isomerase